MRNRIIKNALFDSIGTALYIILVVLFIYFLQMNFPKEDNLFIPIAMLLLFVFSAALTGFLVFGKPAMIYLDGKRKEAIHLLGYTLMILFLITLGFFILLLIYFGL